MDPATAVTIAGLLKDYGPWGLCALLIVAVIYLHKGWQGCQEARVADAKVMATALEKQASTNAESAVALNALRDGQASIMQVAVLLQRDIENDEQHLREKLGDLTRAVQSACRGGAR